MSKIHFHFIYLNAEFDQQIADDFHDGEESEDNPIQLWEDEMVVNVVEDSFKIKNRETYTLRIQQGEEILEFDIPEMTMAIMESEEGEHIQLAASRKLVFKTERKEEEGTLHQYFYLKSKDEPISPYAGLYVLPADFPEMEAK